MCNFTHVHIFNQVQYYTFLMCKKCEYLAPAFTLLTTYSLQHWVINLKKTVCVEIWQVAVACGVYSCRAFIVYSVSNMLLYVDPNSFIGEFTNHTNKTCYFFSIFKVTVIQPVQSIAIQRNQQIIEIIVWYKKQHMLTLITWANGHI